MAKFNFNLRKPSSKEETPINLVIRWNNLRLVYPTFERINPKYWNTKEQLAREVQAFPKYSEFNTRLKKLKTDAEDVFRKYLNDNENRPPTPQELKEALNNRIKKEPQKKDLFSFIKQFIEEAELRTNDNTGKTIARSTIQVYKRTLELLQEYGAMKRKRIDFDTIDLDFYYDFTGYLTRDKGFETNTVGKTIKTLKTFLNEATERELNTNLKFKSKRFKVLREETDSIYLTEQELEDLHSLDLSKNRKLERARDLFLVGCWTGLRFSDLVNIKPENIVGDYIEITTIKTGRAVVIPLHNTVKEIMSRYDTPNHLPPGLSNVNLNKYIKDVGEMVESLNVEVPYTNKNGSLSATTTKKKYELITTHTARRSFATNLYNKGLNTITIRAITGHKDDKAFLRYIKVTPKDQARKLEAFWKTESLKVVK